MAEPLDVSELPEEPKGKVTTGEVLRYTTLVWITSVLISPVILMIITAISEGRSLDGFLAFIFLFVLYGGALSIPNWLLFFGGVAFLTRQFSYRRHIRWGAQAWAVFLTFGLFLVIFGWDDPSFIAGDGLLFPGVYLLVLSVGIWYYPLRRKV